MLNFALNSYPSDPALVVAISPNSEPLSVNLEVSGTPLGITFYGSPVSTALKIERRNFK